MAHIVYKIGGMRQHCTPTRRGRLFADTRGHLSTSKAVIGGVRVCLYGTAQTVRGQKATMPSRGKACDAATVG